MQGSDPSLLGINSWIEDELYQQYQFDRKSVDEGWTDLFVHADENGAAHASNGSASTTAVADAPVEAAAAQPLKVEEPVTSSQPQAGLAARQDGTGQTSQAVAKAAPTAPVAKQETKPVGAITNFLTPFSCRARM